MGVGRNDTCPCGSGKKYKQCCLNKKEEEKAVIGQQQKYEQAKSNVLMKVGDMMVCSEYQNELKKAENIYFALKKPDEQISDIEKLSFYSWFVQDYLLENNEYFIDSFYQHKARNLEAEEKEIALEMKKVSQKIYEILEVTPDTGVVLEEVFEKKRVFILDARVANTCSIGDLMAIRVILVGEQYHPIGIGPYILKKYKEPIICWIEQEYSKYQKSTKQLTYDNFMRKNSLRFLYYYERLIGSEANKANSTQETVFIAEDEVIQLLKQNMKRPYLDSDVEQACNLWVIYKTDQSELKGKPAGFSAGIEYLVNKQQGYGLSQSHIGEKHDVSPSTVAKRYKEISEVLKRGRD